MKLAYLIFGFFAANLWVSPALAAQKVLPLGPVNQMVPDQVYFDIADFEFPDWKDVNHKRFLNLFPNFRDDLAEVTPEQAKLKILPNRDVIMMATQTRILIDRPVSQIEIDPEKNFDQVLKMHDGFAEIRKISSKEIKTSTLPNRYGYRRRVAGAAWCENPSSHCLQLKFIVDLTKLIGMTVRLCMEPDADCSEMYKVMRENPIACANPFNCMEGVQAQGELTFSKPEDGSAEARDVRKLTGIGTPIHALIQESFPWFNHIMEFSRVVIVLQPHPVHKNQTILSTFSSFAISRKWWERTVVKVEMKNVFYGRTWARSSSGLGQGIPGSIQDLTVSIAEELKR